MDVGFQRGLALSLLAEQRQHPQLPQLTDVVREAHNVIQQGASQAILEVQLHQAGEGGNELQVQVATQQLPGRTIGGTAEYVRGLTELAKNFSGLTPAVSTFVAAAILFVGTGAL
jgi:hypothetical protein